MAMQIEPYNGQHREAVVALSLRAWAPVFESLEKIFEPAVYREWYPNGWRPVQQQSVETTCADPNFHTWVARDGDAIAGFVAVRLVDATMGEVYMIAVDPDFQKRGIAGALTEFAVRWMKDQGASICMVETGGDPGHGPARRTYEKHGFRLFPVARYFRKL
jgi:GNAT superfamily N-acetyltransferase